MLVALILDRAERARIAGALCGVSSVQFCELASQLAAMVTADGETRLVLADVHDRTGSSTAFALRAIRARKPALPVLLCLSLTAPNVREVAEIATSIGVSGIIIRGIDDPGTVIRSSLSTLHGIMPVAEVLNTIEPLVPVQSWPFVSYCLAGATGPITVGDATTALRIPRRTLLRQLRRAGLPEPSRIIGWSRLLHATWLLAESDRSLDHIAGTLDFPSRTALYNMLRRYTGLSTTHLRVGRGFAHVLQMFTEELRGTLRETATAPHSHCLVHPRLSGREATPAGAGVQPTGDRYLRLPVA